VTDMRLQAAEHPEERNNTRLYAGVILVEVVVLAGIWFFQRYFGP